MGIWQPEVPVERNRVLELNRGNPAVWTYTLSSNQQFPAGTTAVLELKNTYGQAVGVWVGTVTGGIIRFDQLASIADAIPRGTSWTLTASYGGTAPRQLAQGTVIRSEAPFPDAPANSTLFDAVQYSYSFGTPGFVVDTSWRILNGKPRVYDNSAAALPNAVAAGTLLTGVPWDDVFMMFFAPVKTDAVRFTYNVIRQGNGDAWIAICSNYDATNYACVHHKRTASGDTISIATGTGPVTITDRQVVTYSTSSLDNFTAEFNPSSNTYAVYLGTSLTPLVQWQDATNIVFHGEGERYVGLGFKSALLTPGVEVSDWIVQDNIGGSYGGGFYGSATVYALKAIVTATAYAPVVSVAGTVNAVRATATALAIPPTSVTG